MTVADVPLEADGPHDEDRDVPPRTGLDRRRDLRGWLTTPAMALLVAPAVTLSLFFLTVADSDSYPKFCDAVLAKNGCQEAITAMLAVHARIFAVGWLLLWVMPWWRGLRPFRIGWAAAAGAVLLVAPLRLADWTGLYDALLGQSDYSTRAVATMVVILLVLLAVVVSLVLLLLNQRRAALASVAMAVMLLVPCIVLDFASHPYEQNTPAQVVPNAHPPCVIHSGSNDKCPGG